MLDETIILGRNVVDFARVRAQRMIPTGPSLCRYCGAGLGEGENEEDCSGAWSSAAEPQPRPRRRFRAE